MAKIAYLAHDLSDPAVHRRIAMLRAGGAEVAVAGLNRGPAALAGALDLGPSADGRLAERILRVGRVALGPGALLDHFGAPDVLVARNLEMLALAVRMVGRFSRRPRLVYECLDLHTLLVGDGPANVALRAVERLLAPSVDLVLTSSPAFIVHHLGEVYDDRIAVVENRVLDLGGPRPRVRVEPVPPGPPWRIGWFGALRCRRSLDLLATATELAAGELSVLMRGRPSPAIFPDLPSLLRDRPGVRFDGPYEPASVAAIYAQVHFAWCVDLYEAGANSEWLLPNRLYESLYSGVVPIALAATEAGRVLARHGIGILLEDTSPATLALGLSRIGPEEYARLLSWQDGLPRRLWMADADDCRRLVHLVSEPSGPQFEGWLAS